MQSSDIKMITKIIVLVYTPHLSLKKYLNVKIATAKSFTTWTTHCNKLKASKGN